MRVFNIDITRKGISPVVQVTEYDAMSRFFTLVLRNGSSDYEPPENPTYSVWYKTNDSTGWYDTITLPDESTRPAVVADGNAFTVEIAEQATTSCGELALMINGDDGYQLTVSGIITRSDDIPGYDGAEVENYYNVYITRMQENAARAETAAATAIEYGATVEVDETAQQLIITHTDNTGDVETWVTEAEAWAVGQRDGVDVPSTDETYHNNSKYYAEAAEAAAEAAEASAEDAAASAASVESMLIVTEASGSVAAFSDGANDVAVKSLTATITPVQNLNGQANPYPAGGGVNILPPPVDGTYTGNGITAVVSGGKITLSGTTTASGNAVIIPLSQTVTVPVGSYIHMLNTVSNASISPSFELSSDTAGTNVTASCSPVNRIVANTKTEVVTWDRIRFYLGNGVATNLSLSPMLCMTNTAITTYAPYENICPISGRTGMTVTRAGKNILNLDGYVRASSNGLTFTQDATDKNVIAVSGTVTASWATISSGTFPCKLVSGRTYTLSVSASGAYRVYVRVRNADGTTPAYTTQTGGTTVTWTQTQDADAITELSLASMTSGTAINTTLRLMVEDGASATAYEPYTAKTYPISWQTQAGTVYGGTLNVTTGVLTVDRGYYEFTGDETSFTKSSTYQGSFYIAVQYIVPKIKNQQQGGDFICSHAKYIGTPTASTYVYGCCGLDTSVNLFLGTAAMTVEEFRQWLRDQKTAGTPVTISGRLATPPAPIQLSPTEIKTLLGGNTIYTDAGEVTVDYIADTKLYIDNKVAELQALILEN